MAGVDDDAVAGDVDRREEREAHDVVPVQMGHEHMISARLTRRLAHQARRQRAGSAAQIENRVRVSIG